MKYNHMLIMTLEKNEVRKLDQVAKKQTKLPKNIKRVHIFQKYSIFTLNYKIVHELIDLMKLLFIFF